MIVKRINVCIAFDGKQFEEGQYQDPNKSCREYEQNLLSSVWERTQAAGDVFALCFNNSTIEKSKDFLATDTIFMIKNRRAVDQLNCICRTFRVHNDQSYTTKEFDEKDIGKCFRVGLHEETGDKCIEGPLNILAARYRYMAQECEGIVDLLEKGEIPDEADRGKVLSST